MGPYKPKHKEKDPPHHLKPDCRDKFIRILVCHGRLGILDGYTYDAIAEHFNRKEGEMHECFVGWEALSQKLRRTVKCVKSSVGRLVGIGVFNSVRYRAIEKDTPQDKYHDFDTYAEALVKLEQLRASGLTSQAMPSPLITPTNLKPEMEDFGLKCINHNRHVYRNMTPEEVELYQRKKMDKGVDEKVPRPHTQTSSKSAQKVTVNETYRNKTEPKETDLNLKSNMSDFSQIDLTVVPDDLRDVYDGFSSSYEKNVGSPVPSVQLQHFRNDEICSSIRSNKEAVLGHGGTVIGWTENDVLRMERFRDSSNGRYNPPNIKFLANEKSVSSYLSTLKKSQSGNTPSKSDSKQKSKDTSNSVLSDQNRDRLTAALCERGLESADSVAAVVRPIFLKLGENEEGLNEVIEMITKHFRGDNAQPLRNAALAATRAAYKEGIKSYAAARAQKDREKKSNADRERMLNSPSRTDERCKSVMRTLGEQADRDIEDIDVEDEDLQYFIDRMIDYWGEAYVRDNYSEILARLSKSNSSEIDDEDFVSRREVIDDDFVEL